MDPTNLIVGISGASGVIYGIRTVEVLSAIEAIRVHLVISPDAEAIIAHECPSGTLARVRGAADRCYGADELGAAPASGTFQTAGMIIAPCSARTLACVAHGSGSGLMHRAADVQLKERRRLILLFRETPLHLGHIENMAAVTRMGAVVLPPVPGFYTHPTSLDDIVNHAVGKTLDLFGIPHELYPRWDNDAFTPSA